jgi:hypothetical protein
MSAVYDYEAKTNDDPLLLTADKAIKVFLEVASPQNSAILETFPFRKFLSVCVSRKLSLTQRSAETAFLVSWSEF